MAGPNLTTFFFHPLLVLEWAALCHSPSFSIAHFFPVITHGQGPLSRTRAHHWEVNPSADSTGGASTPEPGRTNRLWASDSLVWIFSALLFVCCWHYDANKMVISSKANTFLFIVDTLTGVLISRPVHLLHPALPASPLAITTPLSVSYALCMYVCLMGYACMFFGFSLHILWSHFSDTI